MSLATFLKKYSTPDNLRIISNEVNDAKNKKNSPTLLAQVKSFNPKLQLKSNSSSKALIALVIDYINRNNSAVGIIRTFGGLKKLFEAVRSYPNSDDAIQKDYHTIRAVIKKKYGIESDAYKKSITNMRFDQAKWKSNKAKYNSKVIAGNREKEQISSVEIYKVMDKIEMRNADYKSLVIGVQLATGARLIEALVMSNFSADPSNKHVIKQTGIAKSRDESNDNDLKKQVVKPVVHYTADTVVAMVDKIRLALKDELADIKTGRKTYYSVSQSYNKKINNRIKELMPDELQYATTHTLRKIYGNLSYHSFANKSKISETAWLAQVLGHDENNITVALSYSTVNVCQPKTECEPETKTKKKPPTAVEIPRNLKKRDGKSYERLLKTIAVMKKNNITPTSRNLKPLGYGSRVIEQYFKTP